MNVYLLEQDENNDYDTFDSCVVVAESEAIAKYMNPDGKWGGQFSGWCSSPELVKVTCIGVALPEERERRFVCKSFNAG